MRTSWAGLKTLHFKVTIKIMRSYFDLKLDQLREGKLLICLLLTSDYTWNVFPKLKMSVFNLEISNKLTLFSVSVLWYQTEHLGLAVLVHCYAIIWYTAVNKQCRTTDVHYNRKSLYFYPKLIVGHYVTLWNTILNRFGRASLMSWIWPPS